MITNLKIYSILSNSKKGNICKIAWAKLQIVTIFLLEGSFHLTTSKTWIWTPFSWRAWLPMVAVAGRFSHCTRAKRHTFALWTTCLKQLFSTTSTAYRLRASSAKSISIILRDSSKRCSGYPISCSSRIRCSCLKN